MGQSGGVGGGRLLASLVPLREQNKNDEKGSIVLKLGNAQSCHHLGWENGILVEKGYVFTSLLKRL